MLTITFTMLDEEGEEIEVKLPARYEVCPRCEGEGKHVNPAIDEHGISREEFEEDPDFEEAYFRGDYDVACEECRGNRVIPVVDEAAAKAMGLNKELAAYYEMMSAEAAYRDEREQERRMGA